MRRSRSVSGIALALGAMLMARAADAAHTAPLTGIWGGRQIQLTLTAAGGTIAFDCAAATIAAAVHPDAHGRFSVAGEHEAYAAGPQRADDAPATASARFDGQIDGTTLHLTIHRAGTPAQTYTLESGRRAKIIRCM